MTVDWQMAHPFWTGVWAGTTLGLWPGQYAIPRACTALDEGMGVAANFYGLLAKSAFPAFHFWAAVFTAVFAWVYLSLLFLLYRRVRSSLTRSNPVRKKSL
jgi:hypothetical protein